jgi:uncharacterized CHY-type Zn-finger protein
MVLNHLIINIMRKYIKFFIYNPSDNLPEEGWFQACFECRTITSDTIKIKENISCFEIIEYDTYLCGQCQKEMNNERYTNFLKKCNERIKKRQGLSRRRSSSFFSATSTPTTPISFSPLSPLSPFSSSPEL